jgi:hypothetical protein
MESCVFTPSTLWNFQPALFVGALSFLIPEFSNAQHLRHHRRDRRHHRDPVFPGASLKRPWGIVEAGQIDSTPIDR